jgi:sulfite reductase beta subunit-like hemoprotein
MKLDEMLDAIERLQVVYNQFGDDQNRSKEKIRWSINHLADKIWSETL